MLILILMAAPLQFPYVFMIRYITGSAIITPAFLITYYVCCTIQVGIMLHVGYMFVHLLWKWGFNPDNNAIPILTACMCFETHLSSNPNILKITNPCSFSILGADLIGSSLFALGFLFLNSISDPNAFNENDLQFSQLNQTVASTIGTTLNSTVNSAVDLTMNSTLSSVINTSTIASTLLSLITANQTESTTVLNNLTTLLNNNLDQLVNGTVVTML